MHVLCLVGFRVEGLFGPLKAGSLQYTWPTADLP